MSGCGLAGWVDVGTVVCVRIVGALFETKT